MTSSSSWPVVAPSRCMRVQTRRRSPPVSRLRGNTGRWSSRFSTWKFTRCGPCHLETVRDDPAPRAQRARTRNGDRLPLYRSMARSLPLVGQRVQATAQTTAAPHPFPPTRLLDAVALPNLTPLSNAPPWTTVDKGFQTLDVTDRCSCRPPPLKCARKTNQDSLCLVVTVWRTSKHPHLD